MGTTSLPLVYVHLTIPKPNSLVEHVMFVWFIYDFLSKSSILQGDAGMLGLFFNLGLFMESISSKYKSSDKCI